MAHHINVIVVRNDATVVTFTERGSWRRAVERALEEADSADGKASVDHVLFRDVADPCGGALERHEVAEMRESLKDRKVLP